MIADSRLFALLCWLLWFGLFVAGITATMPAPIAGAIALAVMLLWQLYRRSAVLKKI